MDIEVGNMKISIIGFGYVGTVTGVCFSELGHEIVFVDVDEVKLNKIKSGKSPVFEPRLEELIQKNKDKIFATKNLDEAIQTSDVTFICVGTPSKKDGSIDLKYIKSASSAISAMRGRVLPRPAPFIVDSGTTPLRPLDMLGTMQAQDTPLRQAQDTERW